MKKFSAAGCEFPIIWVVVVISFIIIGSGSVLAVSVVKEIRLNNPSGIAVNEMNGNVYVANGTTMTVISGQTNEVTDILNLTFPEPIIRDGNISTRGLPVALSWNPSDQKLYVAVHSIYDNAFLCFPGFPCGVLVIDGVTNDVVKVLPVDGYDLQDMAFNPENNKTYLVAGNCEFGPAVGDCVKQARGEVLTIDNQNDSITLLAQVGFSPKGITIDSDNKVYVANQLSDNISVVNGSTGSFLNNLTLQGGRPVEILYNTFNKHIYVTNGFNNSVDVIDRQTNNVIKSIDVGDFTNGISFNPSNGFVYVTKAINNSLNVIDGQTNKVVETVPVGVNPFDVAYNDLNERIYVSNRLNNSVSILQSP